jgi:hypothetical protein
VASQSSCARTSSRRSFTKARTRTSTSSWWETASFSS